MKYEHRQLARAVQHNCNISDARFAGNYTMCVYLLKMREYFRWEMEQDFGANLTRDDVGNWLIAREQLWSDIEDQDYSHLDIDCTTRFIPGRSTVNCWNTAWSTAPASGKNPNRISFWRTWSNTNR